MISDLDLSQLSHGEKDALIWALVARLTEAEKLIAELRAQVDEFTRAPKTPDNSSLPRSKDHKPNRPGKAERHGPRRQSGPQGRRTRVVRRARRGGGGQPSRCRHCQTAFDAADHKLEARYDKIDLPTVRPVVTRVERYGGTCRCCGRTTLAPTPEGLEPSTPFSINILALAMYLRFVHPISYRRLTRLMMDLFGLAISEGALDAALQRGKPRFDA